MKPEHEKWVMENVPNGKELLKSEDPNELLTAIDDLMLLSLGKNYEPTKKTAEISQMYDAIYSDLD